MLYLIQGFFFQEGSQLGIGDDDGDLRVFIRDAMLYTMFSGIIGPDPGNPEKFIGSMTDRYGESQLKVTLLDADIFSFTKIYARRDDSIYYGFEKYPNGIWVGKYHGKMVGVGKAHCVLTIVPKTFLEPNVVWPKKEFTELV